ncbi:estradiol 17-beta-dehydrogenase 2-like isoform X2 [Stegodyphus dumicola]|uniref:estradiol 17-beta-dehydrogenase 2-like isoform X2 n=1 Tax=Stegodyphus dumicola TaxID=202533 RepID=UPI0015AD27E3|nr:estradiol 17-beta-dehydrogenase 2-like isoform X2 [Stegodyphus dumicola]
MHVFLSWTVFETNAKKKHLSVKVIFNCLKVAAYYQDNIINTFQGCDSGFGHHLVKRLYSRGFQVFACCLFPYGEGAVELTKSCSDRLHVLGLDVTDDDSVKEAVTYVKQNLGNSDFWAIVNNAGVYRGNNVELSSMEDYKYTMEVNAFGLARVTKAFLPLLRQFKGRVVNLTSLAGKLAGPHIAPYTMSKHAAKAFSECLALEMGTWGIKVISVEPEFFRTAMTNSKAIRAHLKRTFQDLNPHLKKEYGDDYLDTVRKRVESVFENSSPKMDIVLDDLESAVSLKNPYSAYICYGNIIHAISLYAAERLPKSITDFLVEMYLTIAHGSLRRPHSLKKFL